MVKGISLIPQNTSLNPHCNSALQRAKLSEYGRFNGMRSVLKGEGGFTLLETILTLAILSMVLVIVMSAFRLGISSWEKGESIAEEMGSVRSLSARLSTDIRSIYPYTEKDGEIISYAFVGDEESLAFITAGGVERGAMQYGGTKWVYYSTRESGLTIREKATLSPDLTDDSGGWLIELEPTVERIKFEYRGGDQWENSWNASEEEEFPEFVRASVFFKNKDNPLLITVPLGTSMAKRI